MWGEMVDKTCLHWSEWQDFRWHKWSTFVAGALCHVQFFQCFFVQILAFLTEFFSVQYYLCSLCSACLHGIIHLQKKVSSSISVVIQLSHINFVNNVFFFFYILVKMAIMHGIIMWNVTLWSFMYDLSSNKIQRYIKSYFLCKCL